MNENALKLRILSLRAQNSGAEIAVTVQMETDEECEKRTLTLSMEQYCTIKPKKGEISREEFDRLEEAARTYGAVVCGMRLLAFGSNSGGTLRQKIRRHGFSSDDASYAVEKLAASGFLNEEKDLLREVEKCLKKFWGAKRIRAFLWSKGYEEETLAALPSLLEKADFSENCFKLIQKRYGGIPESPEEKKKMHAFLFRYGYSAEEIKRALKKCEK